MLEALSMRPHLWKADNWRLTGEIMLDGQALTEEVFRHNCAFMQQQDHLWAALTVKENIEVASRPYCPARPDHEAKVGAHKVQVQPHEAPVEVHKPAASRRASRNLSSGKSYNRLTVQT